MLVVLCDDCRVRSRRIKGRGCPLPEGWTRDRRDRVRTWHTCPDCNGNAKGADDEQG